MLVALVGVITNKLITNNYGGEDAQQKALRKAAYWVTNKETSFSFCNFFSGDGDYEDVYYKKFDNVLARLACLFETFK